MLPSTDALLIHNYFFKILFQERYQSVKMFNLGQDRCYVGPDPGLNCLQRLSAIDIYVLSVDVCQNKLVRKILSGTLPECETVWNRSGPTF